MTTIEQLKDTYRFVGEDVEEYLQNNKDLVDILMDAVQPIQKIFGKPQLLLEVIIDNDEELKDYWECLFIIIKANCTLKESLDKDDQLFTEWFEKYADVLDGRLNYIVEPTNAK